MRKANVKIKNKAGEDITYEGVSAVVLETPEETKATFSYGVMSTGTIDLDFSNGNQEIESPDDELYNRLIINVPENFSAENIAEGVEIAGVTGTFQGAGNLPRLNTLSISRNGDTITISNPSTNGNYVKTYRVYLNDEPVLDLTYPTNTFSVCGLKYHGLNRIQVTALASGFEESLKSSTIEVRTYSITTNLTQMSLNNDQVVIVESLTYSTKIIPDEGLFIPEDIDVTMGGNTPFYSWNSYVGLLSIPNVSGDIVIGAVADIAFQIRRPKYKWDENLLSISPERYAEHTYVYLNDEQIDDVLNLFSYEVQDIEGATYNFIMNEDEYYESTNQSRDSTYSICKVVFNSVGDREITISCISYGESNYDYGIISQLNQVLSSSYQDDGSTGSTKVLRNFKGSPSLTPVDLVITIPDGESFMYIKYRKDGSATTLPDSLRFKIISY